LFISDSSSFKLLAADGISQRWQLSLDKSCWDQGPPKIADIQGDGSGGESPNSKTVTICVGMCKKPGEINA